MNINTWYEVEDIFATEINYVYIISSNSKEVVYYYVTFEDTESEYYEFNRLNMTRKEFDMYFGDEVETSTEVNEKYLINKCFKEE